jgi:hypothetical protein
MTPLARCLTCTSPEAMEIRHLNGSLAYKDNCNMSPNLVPLGCCRVKIVNITLNESGAAAVAAPAVVRK